MVSGAAPPGPVGGYHIVQQQQPQGLNQPSAPPLQYVFIRSFFKTNGRFLNKNSKTVLR